MVRRSKIEIFDKVQDSVLEEHSRMEEKKFPHLLEKRFDHGNSPSYPKILLCFYKYPNSLCDDISPTIGRSCTSIHSVSWSKLYSYKQDNVQFGWRCSKDRDINHIQERLGTWKKITCEFCFPFYHGKTNLKNQSSWLTSEFF